MPVLADADTQDIKRLLELFPVAILRKSFPDIKGSKDEICAAVAQQEQADGVANFVDAHFGSCKQHVYVFDRSPDEAPPPAPEPPIELVKAAGGRSLFVVRTQYTVVLKDPLSETTIDFLWPVRVDVTPQHRIVRVVVLEKDIASYVDGEYYVGSRGIDEKEIVAALAGGLAATDLHKGVKKLWNDGFMDSSRTHYKKPTSTASEAMDEELGIKENNPELYVVLQESLLYNTLFVIKPEAGLSVTIVSVNPSKGLIAFPRYSENVGDTDFVIQQILQNNQ